MEKLYFNPGTLLGKVLLKDNRIEVVHLSLLKGNEVPEYSNNATILIYVIKGKIKFIAEEEDIINELEMIKIESGVTHKMEVLKDCQLMIIKIF